MGLITVWRFLLDSIPTDDMVKKNMSALSLGMSCNLELLGMGGNFSISKVISSMLLVCIGSHVLQHLRSSSLNQENSGHHSPVENVVAPLSYHQQGLPLHHKINSNLPFFLPAGIQRLSFLHFRDIGRISILANLPLVLAAATTTIVV